MRLVTPLTATLTALWPALFPPTCAACGLLLRADPPLPLCSRCAPEAHPLAPETGASPGITAFYPYEGPLAAAVNRLKFHGDSAVAGPLGRLLAHHLTRTHAHAHTHLRGPWEVVAPIPLHRLRALRRGYDQVSLLTTWLCRAWPAPTRPLHTPRLLRRIRATDPQTALDREARQANLEGAFVARDPAMITGRRILLIDDVTTTGATLSAGIAALHAAGAAAVAGVALLRALP